eukprot:COSAG05_NODE_1057_length_6003_cov_186.405488_3_plen_85_part_00
MQLHNNIGLVAMKQEHYGAAIAASSKALEHDPANAKALYRRGCARFSQVLSSSASPAEPQGQASSLALADAAWQDVRCPALSQR